MLLLVSCSWLFEKFRDRNRVANLLVTSARAGLPPVYGNVEAVHDELIDILYAPSEDPGALDVFVG